MLLWPLWRLLRKWSSLHSELIILYSRKNILYLGFREIILMDLKPQIIFTISRLSLWFWEICAILKGWILSKWGYLMIRNSPKLILREIRVTEKFITFHILMQILWHFCTSVSMCQLCTFFSYFSTSASLCQKGFNALLQ